MKTALRKILVSDVKPGMCITVNETYFPMHVGSFKIRDGRIQFFVDTAHKCPLGGTHDLDDTIFYETP